MFDELLDIFLFELHNRSIKRVVLDMSPRFLSCLLKNASEMAENVMQYN
jgi:hypothetical protein